MLIIRSVDVIHDMEVIYTDDIREDDIRMDDIRRLAEQVVCCVEDMEYVEERNDLLRQPVPPVPQPIGSLTKLFYEKTAVLMYKWAEKRGFRIKRFIYYGPQIVWLQGDGLLARKDRISIFIVVRLPRSRDSDGSDETTEVITTSQAPAAR
ncbi:hypothetical protein QBC46DRAFT_390946 [Diplogelasinospora grovesii]|uniref:Uncharacterized protein n=1 Tax=Diplogelasinospora grovesii TaxID=303347 RepID=A0AAN6N3G1_9PEZI|nr:hypothetical protein QBC46DRAFT_390946 [Diplogelasinospora grovesii]